MRDYYLSYLGKKTEIPPRCEGAKGAEGAYAPSAPSVGRDIPENFTHEVPSAPSLTYDFPENFSSEDLFITPEELEQFFFEIEERIAIMVYDGGMPEDEAEVNARADVHSAWQRSRVGLVS